MLACVFLCILYVFFVILFLGRFDSAVIFLPCLFPVLLCTHASTIFIFVRFFVERRAEFHDHVLSIKLCFLSSQWLHFFTQVHSTNRLSATVRVTLVSFCSEILLSGISCHQWRRSSSHEQTVFCSCVKF